MDLSLNDIFEQLCKLSNVVDIKNKKYGNNFGGRHTARVDIERNRDYNCPFLRCVNVKI